MGEPLKNALKLLNEDECNFIANEFSTTKNEISEWDEERLGEMYDSLCDMELDDSEKSDMASELVTLIGNEIAKAQGMYDEEEFEKELEG